jgi:K+-sensing histidine kinase KdpD
MKGKQKRDEEKQRVRTEETRITGMLNFVVFLAVAAVAYTDWIVIPNVSLGYLYVLPIALSALVNRPPLTVGLAVVCTVLQDLFFGTAPETLEVRIFRDAITLIGFLVVGFLVTLIARQRNRLIAEVRRQRDEYEHGKYCRNLLSVQTWSLRRPCKPRSYWAATTTTSFRSPTTLWTW